MDIEKEINFVYPILIYNFSNSNELDYVRHANVFNFIGIVEAKHIIRNEKLRKIKKNK